MRYLDYYSNCVSRMLHSHHRYLVISSMLISRFAVICHSLEQRSRQRSDVQRNHAHVTQVV